MSGTCFAVQSTLKEVSSSASPQEHLATTGRREGTKPRGGLRETCSPNPLSHGECKFTHTLLQPAFVLSDHAKETVCLHSPQLRRCSALEPFSCSCECASFDLTISAFDLGSMQLGLSLRGEQKLLDSSADVSSCFSCTFVGNRM